MYVSERLKEVIEHSGLTIKDFSSRLGVSKSTFEKYLFENRAPSAEVLAALSTNMGVSSDWLLTGEGVRDRQIRSFPAEESGLARLHADFVTIPRLSVEASAGSGALVDDEHQFGSYAFNRKWLERRRLKPDNLSVIAVRGDSMEPRLTDGDLILVDRGQRQIADGLTYVVRVDDDLVVKSVQHPKHGTIVLLSENQRYPPREVDLKDLSIQVEIVGRVVASMQEW